MIKHRKLGIKEKPDPGEALEMMKKKYLYNVSTSPMRKRNKEKSKFKEK